MDALLKKVGEALPGFAAAMAVLTLAYKLGTGAHELTIAATLLLAAAAATAQRIGSFLDKILYDPLLGHKHVRWIKVKWLTAKQRRLENLRNDVSNKLFGCSYQQALKKTLVRISSKKTTLYKRCSAIGGDGAPGYAWRLAVSKAARTLLVIFIIVAIFLLFARGRGTFVALRERLYLDQPWSETGLVAISLTLLFAYVGFMYSQHVVLYEAIRDKARSRTLSNGEKEWLIPKEGTTT
jgi:hypothetical protein